MSQLVQARAVAVATRVDTAPSRYLAFALGGEMFAVGILNVKEIIEFGNLTEIPMQPSFIRGAINLPGAVVPVIDLAARFGGESTETGRHTCIVIVEVLDIPGSEIEPPPSFGAKIHADFIYGLGKVAGKFVIILNINEVLSVEEIAQLTGTEGAVEVSVVGAT